MELLLITAVLWFLRTKKQWSRWKIARGVMTLLCYFTVARVIRVMVS